MHRRRLSSDSSETGANHKAHIVIERSHVIKRMHAAIRRNIAHISIMAEIAGGIAPRTNRAAGTTKARLRAERSVLVELLGTIAGIDLEREVVMPDIAARCILGLEGEASAVAKTGADGPASLLLKSGSARRGDDLGVNGGAGVRDIPRVVARRGDAQGDRGADGERRAASQRCGGVLGGYDVSLDGVLGGVGGIAGGHHALVERALGAVAVVATYTEDYGALFAHWVVASCVWAWSAVV